MILTKKWTQTILKNVKRDWDLNLNEWCQNVSTETILNDFLWYFLWPFWMYLPMDPLCTWAENFVILQRNLDNISKKKRNFVEGHARLWFSKIKVLSKGTNLQLIYKPCYFSSDKVFHEIFRYSTPSSDERSEKFQRFFMINESLHRLQ